MMVPLDYGRSFLIGKWPENEVRFWVESRTRLIDERIGKTEDYLQCASCKSEDTFAANDLFYEDNYDFLPIFGPEYGLIFRRKAWLNPNYRSCPKSAEMWGGQTQHLVESSAQEELTTVDSIIEATRRFRPIVGQTEIWNEVTGLRAVIECPIKTLNTNRQRMVYQTDTGPVAFAELGPGPYEKLADRLALAFVAWNAPHFADFVIEAPAPAGAPQAGGPEKIMVHHYSRRISLAAKNRLLAVA